MVDYRLELVLVPVADVDVARAFYGDRLGWPVDHDQTVDEQIRFVQVTPPGSACSIAFGRGISQMAAGSLRALQVVVDDIEQVHGDLTTRGVEVSAIDDQPWGRFVQFADPDGNTWSVQQLPTASCVGAVGGTHGCDDPRVPLTTDVPTEDTMLVECSACQAPNPDVLDVLADGRRRYSCNACGHLWTGGSPKPVSTFASAKAAFPSIADVEPDRAARVEALKAEFLRTHPAPDREVAPFWARYQKVFSEAGLDEAPPSELHYFANSATGAAPGNMSVFNVEWEALGPAEGARRVRESVRHLLYGPAETPMEDRLTELLAPGSGIGMKGWKESLLTKVLCVMHPDTYLPILTYTSVNGGKRELAQQIWGLPFPAPDRTTMTIGRLIVWSNQTLTALAGDGFVHQQHRSQFLWTAKDHEAELAGTDAS